MKLPDGSKRQLEDRSNEKYTGAKNLARRVKGAAQRTVHDITGVFRREKRTQGMKDIWKKQK